MNSLLLTCTNYMLPSYCPNGIEYYFLSEVVSIKEKGAITKEELSTNGKYPVINSSRDVLGYYDYFNNDSETLVLTSHGAYAGYCHYLKNNFWAGSLCYPMQAKNNNSVSTKFLYYFLKNIERIIRDEYVNKSGVPYINFKALMNIKVPFPPIQVQHEIVRILDNFTELTAELTARKKQYEYYLNSLLDINKFSANKIMYVGELFEIKNGLNKEKEAFGKGTPIVNFTDVYNKRYLTTSMINGRVTLSRSEIERYKVKKGDVFFTRTSETKEDIGMSSTIIEDINDCTFSGFVLRARPKTDLLLPKFCSYYFSTHQVRKTIVRYASFTTRATTSGPKLSKIPVPIIPLEEQERIVDILDKFDMYCNDLTKGLPAEIEARQKQYEYYRDKLLTFKKLEV